MDKEMNKQSLKESLSILSTDERLNLAINTYFVEILDVFSEDEDWQIRACVANNPHTPSSILFKLKTDDADSVKYTAEKALSERKSSKYDIDR